MKSKVPPELPATITAEDLDELYTKLGLKTTAANEFLKLSLQCVIMFDGKQQDYGPDNITDFGTFGVVVRMNDKFRRIKHMRTARRRHAVNEPMLDSFLDIANYGKIAWMVEKGLWPREEFTD